MFKSPVTTIESSKYEISSALSEENLALSNSINDNFDFDMAFF